MYKINVSPAAEKQLKSLPKREQSKIVKRIAKLADDPRPAGVKRLQGITGLYRLRQGNWRIVYTIEDRRLIVLILKIGHRRNVYQSIS